MGICFGRSKTDVASTARRNTLIEASIERDKQKIGAEVKLLLLGAGESGKSTVLKQMKVIHEGGYGKTERLSFRFAIYSNILDSAQRLCGERQKRGSRWTDRDLSEEERTILDTDPMSFAQSTPTELLACVQQIYQDPMIKQLVERGSPEFYLLESTKYYFDQLDVIAQADWTPSDQDILQSRVKTTGITEILFKIGRLSYRMFDVGGQRSERKKWKNCFDGVTAIIFMVAISEYDQVLLEDPNANRMRESLALFSSIINYRPFEHTPIILFFNKIDVFESKLASSPIEAYFPDYTGGPFYDAGCQYFKSLFISLDRSGTNRMYVHFTCATDTQQIKFVMEAVNDIFIQTNLRAAGLV